MYVEVRVSVIPGLCSGQRESRKGVFRVSEVPLVPLCCLCAAPPSVLITAEPDFV